jgi:DNA modification methylase
VSAARYQDFLDARSLYAPSCGRTVERGTLHSSLFDFQRDIVWWALQKGRCAIFADTGLGKTFMQLEWARHAGDRVLILAPLSVAHQTVREAARWGIDASYCKAMTAQPGIIITNYERLDAFDAGAFDAVVLDESSILKNYEGKTRTAIIQAFAQTPMRLACTATPAPNDIAEIANHAEFLGLMTRAGMLATFFVHDQDGWRLKRPATDKFYHWLASWGVHLKGPADLGYDGSAYKLPPLDIVMHSIPTDYVPDGQLFATTLSGVGHRAKVRKNTASARVAAAAGLVSNEPTEQWIAWCGLNDESSALAAAIPGAVEVHGSLDPDEKARRIDAFLDGTARVLVTKPTIAGFGMNFQHCARQVFVGLGDSYEQYYHSIRRCWRFGQSRPVKCWIVLSDLESAIYANVMRKQVSADELSRNLVANLADFEKSQLHGTETREDAYMTDDAAGDRWRLMLGDSAERLKEIPDASVGVSVFSPPFLSLFQYSNSPRDLGNCNSPEDFWNHFGFIFDDLKRVMMPGRNLCVHVANVSTTMVMHGAIGLYDFRGDTIRQFVKHGFIYHGEVCIDKDPQAQAIRTHSKGLLFVQKNKDSAWSRPALADYIIIFRSPGENAVPIVPDVSNNEWIEWARPIWYGIKESDTLNRAEGREQQDERHICPLQLGTIERCLRLWSNPGEMVLSPFAGIGSEGYEAVRLGRRFVGVELKESYYRAAIRNLKRAEESTVGMNLFNEAQE